MEFKTSFDQLQNTLNVYIAALEKYSDADFEKKQSDDIWSLGQMYEHLETTANFFFLKNIKYCMERRNGQPGGDKSAAGQNVFKYNGIPPIKVKVPFPNLEQPTPKARIAYGPLLEKVQAQLHAQEREIAQAASDYKTEHIVFGWLNAQEWLQAFEMHHRHHLRQKAELEGYLQ